MPENRRTDEKMPDPSKYSIPEQKFQVQIKLKPEAGVRVDKAYRLSSITDVNLSSLKDILMKHDVKLERAFAETEDALTARVAEAKADGIKLPDLSRSYVIRTKDKAAAEAVAKDLIDNDLVEVAEVTPPAVPADVDVATSNFFGTQGYLGPAPGGIDAKYAWTKPGGKGTGIKMIDIEGAWNFNHEDLQENQSGLAGGTMTNSLAWRNHGTAVLGEIGGDENGFGVTGIAPKCNQRGYSIFGTGNDTHLAIKGAADLLQKGDIILIELHRPGPDASGAGQDGYIAIEWWPLDFDAIKYATAKGIIVVEAAGNGSRDLDATVFQSRFNRSNRDSGAILVGAGAPPSGTYGPDRSRLSFSNWGAIIDTQGWGREVVTTAYGDLQGGADENKWYTKRFSGTSSASPIIVGALACLQGIRKNKGEPPLTFNQLRKELRTSGSPQQDHPNRPKTQRIGNRPDLKKIINKLWPDEAVKDDGICFVKKALTGSMLVPQVQSLRMFRDEIVMKSVFRDHFKLLLKRYYQYSPSVVKKMEESPRYKTLIKYFIAFPFVLVAKVIMSSTRTLAHGKSTHSPSMATTTTTITR